MRSATWLLPASHGISVESPENGPRQLFLIDQQQDWQAGRNDSVTCPGSVSELVSYRLVDLGRADHVCISRMTPTLSPS